MPPPEQVSTVYATDESIAIRARGDFAVLCPEWQKLAYGTDGVVSSGSPWVLTSTAVNFATCGVTANHVLQIRKSGSVRGTGDILAVESVSGTSVTLRRIGQVAGVGQPPIVATSIEFVIATLDPQIEEASFALDRRFGIDPLIAGKRPADLYDVRDLREACILTVLHEGYVSEARSKDGDFWGKAMTTKEALDEVIGRLQLRWSSNNTRKANPRTTSVASNCRIVR